ncbi:zinc finger HIT domain-containing protein 1 [Cimex lectularius]|uniref:HIT-type domain-containing protein n=1 Tax=Cimex lectularius TaxID=79782 RepID=A0A8I6TD07_CIMLE|nr:zinc finger HIT domain-containing protein 1 [Cimex lectularius]
MASRGVQNRESGRLKDSNQKRILDEATRQRRAKQAVEALDSDNFHEDPHGDLVANKNAPKFHDTLRESRKSRRSKSADYYKFKYRKSFSQMVEYETLVRPDAVKFTDAVVPPSNFPTRNFCSPCGFPSNYHCITCGSKYCSVNCLRVHTETRCLKWTA